MQVNKIYYYEDKTSQPYHGDKTPQAIVEFLRKKRGFRTMKFVPLKMDDLVDTSACKKGFPIEEEQAILIWGDGYKHTASYWFSPQQNYFKSVDDAHQDLESFSNALNCTNHNYFLLLNDPYVQSVEVLGCMPMSGGLSANLGKGSFKPIYDKDAPKKNYETKPTLDSSLSGVVIHKSIDLDVIHRFPVFSDHIRDDPGKITLRHVRKNLARTLKDNDVVRFDVGGLKLYANNRAERKGMKAYQTLIETCLAYK